MLIEIRLGIYLVGKSGKNRIAKAADVKMYSKFNNRRCVHLQKPQKNKILLADINKKKERQVSSVVIP